MGGEQAAGTLAEVKLRQLQRTGATGQIRRRSVELRAETLKAYEEQTSALLLHLGTLGRRHPRSGRYPQRAGHRALGGAECARGAPGNGVFRF